MARTPRRIEDEQLGAPFPHDAYATELARLRDELKAGLSRPPSDPKAGPPPPVHNLAERIKTLKAGHTVEASPDRATARRIAAEEPVTARIRRRTAQSPDTEPPTDPELGASPAKIVTATEAEARREEEPEAIDWPHPDHGQKIARDGRRNGGLSIAKIGQGRGLG